jgi:hypothetical protein
MIEMVIEQQRRDLGGGFEVGRVLPRAWVTSNPSGRGRSTG